MTETKTAMRDSNGTPVFVTDNGHYSETFPAENIVRRAKSDSTQYEVFGFVGTDSEYVELHYSFDHERDARQCATAIYGETVDVFTKQGEVFEVEVHETDTDPRL